MNADLMTILQVAEYMGLNVTTAYRLAEAKKIPAKKVAGRWYVSRARLKEFLGVPQDGAVQQ